MSTETGPSISAVIAAFEAEEWIAEAIDSILGQTRPPSEVVVVDDGSTDRTTEILRAYGDRIRVFRQENAGYPMAMNRAIRESVGDLVAPCGADDLWEPRKLEWQLEALARHPEVGVLFGHAVFFGPAIEIEHDHVRPTGSRVLDPQTLCKDLFRMNPINMPSAVIDRKLFGRLGWFTDRFLADDFEFFFRCLRAGVAFYYEPRTLVRYRRHDDNITKSRSEVLEATHLVRSRNRDLLADERLAAEAMADDLFNIGRAHLDEGSPIEARRAIRQSLRYGRGNTLYSAARGLVWIAILSLPSRSRASLANALLTLRGPVRRLPGVRHLSPA